MCAFVRDGVGTEVVSCVVNESPMKTQKCVCVCPALVLLIREPTKVAAGRQKERETS